MRSAAKGNRQLNTSRQGSSNAGFSLIELLIAVTILAIIVIPLLHMFVTSTRVNVKSRQMLRATTVAQDIMEGLKAYNLEEVRVQFAPPEGVSPSTYYYPSNGFYVLNTNLIQGGVREITELGPDATGEEIYYFGIENLKMQGGEYDAFIKLDASTYGANSKEGTGAGVTPGPGAHDKEFNGAFYAEIAGVSETSGSSSETDSSFHEDKNLNKDILKDVKLQVEAKYAANPDLGDLPENWDEVKLVISGDAGTADNIAIVSRNIHVLLDQAKDEHGNPKKDAEGNLQCRAAITFTYKCIYKGEEYTSYGYDGMPGHEIEYYRTFSSGNFYLFYYPIYKTGGQIDSILFEVKDASQLFDEDKPLLKSITLAKQIRSSVDTDAQVIAPDMSNSELWQAEIDYIMDVNIKILDGTMKNDLVFRDNLGMNLAKNPTDPTGDRQITNGNAKHLEGFAFNTNIKSTDMTGGNVSSKVTNVIYDIEITVYETGAAQYFTEPNFETTYRDDVHKLASITNLD